MAYQLESTSEDRMTLSIGPHHPSTHGVLRLVLELDGETIVKVEPEIGFLHTGIEKNAENLTWQQAITVLDRMDYLSPLSNNLGYVLACERLLGVEAPPRARYARIVLTELQRIASHLVWLGTHALDLGAQSVYFYTFDMREAILDIFEDTTGARMNPSYFRIGGLAYDLNDDFATQIDTYLEKLPARLAELHTILDRNPIWVDRIRRVGALTGDEAIALGLTGPGLRASGVDYDVRKAFPYGGYEEFDFDVPLGENGDVHDRYVIRMLEIDESVKIIKQALKQIPDGRWAIDDPKITPPPKPDVKKSMEALIHHFKLVSYGFDIPPGEIYQPLESPRGEIGFYVISDGTNKPYRVRVRPPSFYNVFAMPSMMEGRLLADMVAIIASTDPVFGEVDR